MPLWMQVHRLMKIIKFCNSAHDTSESLHEYIYNFIFIRGASSFGAWKESCALL